MAEEIGWHLDRRVPLAMIAVLIAQAVGFGALYGTLKQQVNHNSERITLILNQQEVMRNEVSRSGAALAEIQADIRGLRRDITRLIQLMDGAIQR